MNRINFTNNILKIIKFNKYLYRADSGSSSNYSGAKIKYFTIKKNETNTYAKYYSKQGNTSYIKTWEPKDDLTLIDILHKPTRVALGKIIGNDSLDVSFPIKGNKVSRISEEDTKNEDYKVLKSICELDIADGYIMDTLENNNGKYVFHSEVGLCSRGLSKLKLVSSEKNTKNPPGLAPRKRATYTRKNNNNNNNSELPRVKRFSAIKPLSFD